MYSLSSAFLLAFCINAVFGKKEAIEQRYSLGAFKLSNVLYNVLVDETYFVGRLFGTSVFKVESVKLELLTSKVTSSTPETKMLSVSLDAVKSFLDSAGFYYGVAEGKNEYKIWTNMLCNFDPSRCPKDSNSVHYSDYFVNNRKMLEDMKKYYGQSDKCKAVKAIRGVVTMKCFEVPETGKEPVCATIMSRTSAYRTAPRMFSRGADIFGHAGNTAEVETILSLGKRAASFVQFRGSIPFIWSQPPSWTSVMPTVVLHEDEGVSKKAFAQHLEHMKQLYPLYGRFKLLSLIEGESNLEKDLAETYQKFYNEVAKNSVFDYVAFGFNSAMGKKKEKTNELVWQEPWFGDLAQKIDFNSVGFTVVDNDSRVQAKQQQIIRTSCLSTLDRTSAVQRQISDHQVSSMLSHLLPSLSTPPADLLQWMAQSWVLLANTIAFQYAGTDAKKTDIILTGKSSIVGRLKDYTVGTLKRHVNANYYDAFKRDVMEVIYGAVATSMTGDPAREPEPESKP